jgi:hypothetical protein
MVIFGLTSAISIVPDSVAHHGFYDASVPIEPRMAVSINMFAIYARASSLGL